MRPLENNFSWSFSRHRTFHDCPRKYWFHYYGSWEGWSDDAPAEAQELYRLKNITGLHLLAGDVVHRAIEAWLDATDTPFVFALWIVRKEVARKHGKDVVQFVEQLNISRAKAFLDLEEVVNSAKEMTWMGEQRLMNYLNNVSYDLTPLHLEGLSCFYTLLEKHDLIESVPELEFIQT